MTLELSRRSLLRGALTGGALVVAVSLTGCGPNARARRVRHADATGELLANMYITILPSGVVVVTMNKAEIGQGVTTLYATLVAEELEVEPHEIEIAFADSLPEWRTLTVPGVPMFALHATGGSTSTAAAYVPVRRAAAAAREMLVGAAALDWGLPAGECAARAGAVHHAASGRSKGYGELTAAAARQPAPDDPRLKPASEFRLVGKYGARIDARAKVVGSTVYGIDVSVPDMVNACAIHGPRYGAKPKVVRDAAARAQPGVLAVLALPWGVAVVAEKYWQARRAAQLVEVEWGDGKTRGLDTDALAAAARDHDDAGAPVRDDGDADRAVRGKAVALDAVYQVPYLAQAPLEPQNCTVSIAKGKVEVWAPCQVPTVIQEAIAAAVDVDSDDVLVHSTYAGGGFGRRLVADFAAQAATIAKRMKRPVKLIWSRESDTTQGFYRPAATARVRGALDGKGRVAGLRVRLLAQAITGDSVESLRGGQPTWMPAFVRSLGSRSMKALALGNTAVDMFATEGAADMPYRIPNLRVEYTPIQAGISVGSWRSVASSYTGFFVESALDELAHAAGADPYAFRRDHLAAGSRELRVLDAVAKLAGWGAAPPRGHAWGIARHTAFGSEAAQIAEVTVDAGRIRVTRVWCAVELGRVVNPDVVRAQVEGGIIFGLGAALDQAITLKDGVVQETNFDTFPSLRLHESPAIEVSIVDSTDDPTGSGELAVPPIAPAVANAIFTLTGKRLRTLPLQAALAAT
jgi:isoquinoline 1-oxidoreductase beta subunit